MQIVSLYYFAEVAKDLNITKTAKRIFVSQQNLSHHIQRLESYYGVKLFTRRPAFALTYAGEQLLPYARRIAGENEMVRELLTGIDERRQGILRIGATTPRASIFVPPVVERFHRQYPEVRLNLYTRSSGELEQMMAARALDLAVGLIYPHDPELTSYHLVSERVYLLVHDGLLRRCLGEDSDRIIRKSRNGAEIRDFAAVPVVLPDTSVSMGNILRECYEEAECQPKALMTTMYPQFFLPLAERGCAAFFIMDMIRRDIQADLGPEMHVFPLLQKGQPLLRDLSVTINQVRCRTPYAECFIDMVRSYFRGLESGREDP